MFSVCYVLSPGVGEVGEMAQSGPQAGFSPYVPQVCHQPFLSFLSFRAEVLAPYSCGKVVRILARRGHPTLFDEGVNCLGLNSE